MKIDEVVIVGGGPVGSFTAVLMSLLEIPVTVYEKHTEYLRETNLKLEKNIFKTAQLYLNNLKIKDDFFAEMLKYLEENDSRILMKTFESKLKEKAISNGAKYISEEAHSFAELYRRHFNQNPLILDCTGRASKLRSAEFGDDADNFKKVPLESALHIKLNAKFDRFRRSILTSVVRENKNIKLSDLVVNDNQQLDGFKEVIVPVFVSRQISELFEKNYPHSTKKPLRPFDTSDHVPDEIFATLASIVGTFIMENWDVDYKSVQVKKIDITCGYGEKRSHSRFVCLGDSAVHLAYYRSLNFGLQHVLDFFVLFSDYWGISHRLKTIQLSDEEIVASFKKEHPHLFPVKVVKTMSRNSYIVVTRVVLFTCYKFCFTNSKSENLTGIFGVKTEDLDEEYAKCNQELLIWENHLKEFEARRENDVQNEIKNYRKKNVFNYLADVLAHHHHHHHHNHEKVASMYHGSIMYKEEHDLMKNALLILKDFHGKNGDLEKRCSDYIVRLINLYHGDLWTKKLSKKEALLKKLSALFDEANSEGDFGDRLYDGKDAVIEAQEYSADGDLRFNFIIKCVDDILDNAISFEDK